MGVYMEFTNNDGKVTGDVVDPKGYKDQIRVHSVGFGLARSPVMMEGGTMDYGRLKSHGARFSCVLGRHAVRIWQSMALNHVVSVIVTYDNSDDGDDPQLRVTLKGGRVTECNFMVSNSTTLDFTIHYTDVEIEHVPSSEMHTDTLAHEAA